MEQPSSPPPSPTNVVENIRCIKCKDKTGNVDVEQIFTASNRSRIMAKCEQCGSTKTRFGSIDVPVRSISSQPKKEKIPKKAKAKKDKINTYVNMDDLPTFLADMIKLYNK